MCLQFVFLWFMESYTCDSFAGNLCNSVLCTFYPIKRYTPLLQVVFLLLILFVFKYFNFFADNLLLASVNVTYTDLILPVGISFYVFQAISFVVDHERQHISKIGFSETLAYISFFPQLVAGPIVRASVFLPQLKKARKFNKYMFYTGLLLFFMGLFKKVVIADNVGLFVDSVYATPGATSAGNHVSIQSMPLNL